MVQPDGVQAPLAPKDHGLESRLSGCHLEILSYSLFDLESYQ